MVIAYSPEKLQLQSGKASTGIHPEHLLWQKAARSSRKPTSENEVADHSVEGQTVSRNDGHCQRHCVNQAKKHYNFKESKHDRFGKRPAVNVAEKIDERSTEADVCTFRRSIGLFFFFYDRLRTLDLRFLLWMYLDSNLLERFRSARLKAITFFAAHLAESSLREEPACGPVIELLHRSCNWLK